MKAPNKIYIPLTEGQDILTNDWSGVPMFQDSGEAVVENVEYIRKDSLLEWAEDYLQKADNLEMWFTMNTVINKLKSM